jgi:hypothetical protein
MTDIIDIPKGNSIAIIIAIEDYRFAEGATGIVPVKYARNDATKFKKLLREEFDIPDENIIMWLDKDAIKAALEDELKYHIRQLKSTDRFIFYYAGHGFYQNSNNKLTCWDTHPTNLSGTTVSLKEILLDPLEQSECEQSLIFLDCCSTNLTESLSGRDLISNFNDREFEVFIKSKKYNAIFMSCSPGEKSYPSEILKHGIWTYHLIEALKGNVPDAIVKDIYITDNTIRNYLSSAIPKFITEKTIHRDTQRPYSKVNSSNEFLIRQIQTKEDEINNELPNLKLKFDKALFRKVVNISIRRAKGFLKGHFAPEKVNASGNSFIQRVFEENLKEEIQTIYENTKEILSLRKKQIAVVAEIGGGSIECDTFRYLIDIEQNPYEPSEAKVTRKLIIRAKRSALVENFDDIFLYQIDEIVIPYEGNVDFDDLVEKFENLQEIDGGQLYDNEMKGEIEYKTYSGLSIKINIEDLEVVITPNRTMKCMELIDTTMEGLKKITGGGNINLLN